MLTLKQSSNKAANAAEANLNSGRRWLFAVLMAGWPLISPAQEVVDVEVAQQRFSPAEVTVKVGTRVRWSNLEKRTSHSVLFTGEGGFESERFFPGETYEREFDRPGTYPYICGPHPEMNGVVHVE